MLGPQEILQIHVGSKVFKHGTKLPKSAKLGLYLLVCQCLIVVRCPKPSLSRMNTFRARTSCCLHQYDKI